MFIISKNVAEGIRALGRREDVRRELDAIRAMPGFEVYVNAIAEGVGDDPVRRHRPRQGADGPASDAR